MEKSNFRSYIQTRIRLGIKAVDIFKELKQTHGTQAPCYSTVQKCAALFVAGRESIEDDPRSGHPITANIEIVRHIGCKAANSNGCNIKNVAFLFCL